MYIQMLSAPGAKHLTSILSKTQRSSTEEPDFLVNALLSHEFRDLESKLVSKKEAMLLIYSSATVCKALKKYSFLFQ